MSRSLDSLARALQAGVAEPVLSAEDALRPYSQDFGRTVRRMPVAVVRARGEQDLVHTLGVAREWGVPVSVRGAGHSCRAQSLCEGGIVLDNSGGEPHVALDDEGRVEVTTRTRWDALEAALNRAGRTAPVLTDHLATTVGGTLSVAGYGARSIQYGAHLDQVERLRLILPDGTARWCSEHEDAELFQFALGGFGQVGIIERVVMRTLPHRPVVRLQTNRFASFTELVKAIAWTAEEDVQPDHFFGQQKNEQVMSVFGMSHLDPDTAGATPLPGPAARMTKERTHALARPSYFVQARDVGGQSQDARPRQYWSDYCFELEGLRAFVHALEAGPRERIWNKNCLVRMLCLRRGRTPWPFDIRSIGTAPRLYGIGIYYRIEPGEPGEEQKVALARAAHADFLARCLALGGRPYLYGHNELTSQDMHRVYGAPYARLRALRRELDPQELLNRGALP